MMTNKVNKIIICFIFAVFSASKTFAEQTYLDEYLDNGKPFILHEDPERQSKLWLICSASLEIGSLLFNESQPSTAKVMKNLSNGAAMAAGMTHVMDLLSDEDKVDDNFGDKFNSRWNYAKHLISNGSETYRDNIMMHAEQEEMTVWITKLTSTIKVCQENQEAQQMYIDSWRSMLTEGLLKAE